MLLQRVRFGVGVTTARHVQMPFLEWNLHEMKLSVRPGCLDAMTACMAQRLES